VKILVVGGTGMLGYSLFANLSSAKNLQVYSTVRSIKGKEMYFYGCEDRVFTNIDIKDLSGIKLVLENLRPSVVINCIGLIKQNDISKQHVDAVAINSLLPHQLAQLCDRYACKLIHFSTDCVFSGNRGSYTESDIPDSIDLYGRSKSLGEVNYKPHLTLRTSIIGHELTSQISLIDWFLSQKASVHGYSKAVFSGLPTCIIARILINKILPMNNLSGTYHLSALPIDKFTLLKLVAHLYSKNIKIVESTEVQIDRSLNSDKLCRKLSLEVPSWRELVKEMYIDYKDRYEEFR